MPKHPSISGFSENSSRSPEEAGLAIADCHFCNDSNVRINYVARFHFVVCWHCASHGPMRIDSAEDAVKDWNNCKANTTIKPVAKKSIVVKHVELDVSDLI